VNAELKNAFERLWQSDEPHKRGRLFEELFCRLLFKSSFDVHKNAKTAKPRQTDLLAEHEDNFFLFELKWLNRRVDIDVIAQIKDRLGRTRKGTIGCICSPSGFTESLINDIELHRHEFEILLFNPFEIYQLFSGEVNVLELINEKRHSMRHFGSMWFLKQGPRSSARRYVELPYPRERLALSSDSIHFKLASTDISDIVFARVPLIFDEYLWAVSLKVDLKWCTLTEIREAVTAATNYLGLRGAGTFGIRQSTSGWYGLGSEKFLKEIARYRERYKDYQGPIHHSEELVFFEELNRGLFLLTARQSLTREGMIHSGKITLRLPGIPADARPYLKFIQTFAQKEIFFTPEEPLRRATRLTSSVKIGLSDVIVTVQEIDPERPEGPGVSGIVIKNPFFKNANKIMNGSKDEAMSAFSEPEYLICTLDDWLDVGDEVDGYFITALETVRIGEVILLHPRCTWKKITKRAVDDRGDVLDKLQSEWKQRERWLSEIKQASKRQKLRP
jgi:hypothetical protein